MSKDELISDGLCETGTPSIITTSIVKPPFLNHDTLEWRWECGSGDLINYCRAFQRKVEDSGSGLIGYRCFDNDARCPYVGMVCGADGNCGYGSTVLGSASCVEEWCEEQFSCGGGYVLDEDLNQVYFCDSTWVTSGVAVSDSGGMAKCTETDHPRGSNTNWYCDSWIFEGAATDGPVYCTSGDIYNEIYSPRTGHLISFSCSGDMCQSGSVTNQEYSSETGLLIGYDCE